MMRFCFLCFSRVLMRTVLFSLFSSHSFLLVATTQNKTKSLLLTMAVYMYKLRPILKSNSWVATTIEGPKLLQKH